MARIEKKYLAPLNPRTIISERDRQRVYDIVRGHLSDLISGDRAYHRDGVQKDDQARVEAVEGYINSIGSLRGQVDDPSDILGEILADLTKYIGAIKKRVVYDTPVDKIELPPALTPQTSDQNSVYVDPDPGPFSPPNPLSPSRSAKQFDISFPALGSVGNPDWLQRNDQREPMMHAMPGAPIDDVSTGSSMKSPLRGLVSGRAMRQLPIGLSVFSAP